MRNCYRALDDDESAAAAAAADDACDGDGVAAAADGFDGAVSEAVVDEAVAAAEMVMGSLEYWQLDLLECHQLRRRHRHHHGYLV